MIPRRAHNDNRTSDDYSAGISNCLAGSPGARHDPRSLTLQLAIELAFRLAQLSRQALEGFPLFHFIFGLDLRDSVGDRQWRNGVLRRFWGERLDEQGDFAAHAVADGQFAADIWLRFRVRTPRESWSVRGLRLRGGPVPRRIQDRPAFPEFGAGPRRR